ncbi:MAG: HAMP domain-containing histidine kinase [Deltaproteobacteria bacterium]|nr:HAMP domain-containing histidine kinase [Deltaproteobacteria bacterium]
MLRIKVEIVNRKAINAGFWCIIFFFPLWMAYDWISYPDHKWKIMALRLAVIIYTLVARFWIYRINKLHLIWLTGVTGILAATALSMICVITGEGFSSPSYAGIFPIVLGICIVSVFSMLQLSIVIGIILVQHFAILWHLPWSLQELHINIFFLGGTAALGMVLAGYIYELNFAEWQTKEINKYLLRIFGHDIKNRLSASFLFLEKLGLKPGDGETLVHLDHNLSDINRMINNLVNVFSMDKIELNRVKIDAGKLADRISENWKPVSGMKEIDFKVEVRENPVGFWDKEYTQIVWDNLLSNAFQYTEKGGVVTVTIGQEGNQTILSFCNSGPLVPEAQRPHLFEKYLSRQDHSPYNKGLGLHYSRMMCELHGGRIDYFVTGDGLNEFRVCLPETA